MSYEIGDKFIFEIDRIYSSKKHADSRFGIKGFENLVLSKRKLNELLKHKNIEQLEEHDIAVFEEAFQKGFDQKSEWFQNDAHRHGLEDAWEAARKVFAEMDYDDVCDCFGVDCGNDNERFFDRFSPQEAIERLKGYKPKKAEESEIHLGDEVEAWDTNEWVKFVAVGDIGDGSIVGFDLNGGSYDYPRSSCRKTGKHYDIKEASNAKDDQIPWA